MKTFISLEEYDYIKIVAYTYQQSYIAYKSANICGVSETTRYELFLYRKKQRAKLFELLLSYGLSAEQAIEIIDSYIEDELCSYQTHVANSVVKTLNLTFIEKDVLDHKGGNQDGDQSETHN
jgi:hypothetical protein